MATKRIEIKLDDKGDIQIFNNDELKHTIKVDDNEITGQIILDTLNAKIDDEFELIEIQDDSNNKRYKQYQMIYDLYKDIIGSIKTKENEWFTGADTNKYEELK